MTSLPPGQQNVPVSSGSLPAPARPAQAAEVRSGKRRELAAWLILALVGVGGTGGGFTIQSILDNPQRNYATALQIYYFESQIAYEMQASVEGQSRKFIDATVDDLAAQRQRVEDALQQMQDARKDLP